MIAKLYFYFGLTGLISIAAWLAALIVTLNYAFHARRTRCYVRALCLAVAGLLFAMISAYQVSLVQVDRTEEMRAALVQQRHARQAELDALRGAKAANIRFVEDGANDALDMAGVRSAESKSIYEQAAEGKEPLYKQQGKQKREAGQPAPAGGLAAKTAVDELPQVNREQIRLMSQKDYDKTRSLNRLNLWQARLALALVLLALILDYFSRFNKTIGALLPLPFAGRTVDRLFPKTHAAVMRSGRPELVQRYLETSVRKGEAFIYFGAPPVKDNDVVVPRDLFRIYLPFRALWRRFLTIIWPAGLAEVFTALMQWKVAGRSLQAWLDPARSRMLRICDRFFNVLRRAGRTVARAAAATAAFTCRFGRRLRARIKLPPGLADRARNLSSRLMPRRFFRIGNGTLEMWPVRILDYTPERRPFSAQFVFESVWFRRYCFAVIGADLAAPMLAALIDFLDNRNKPRAVAGKTVHIVWNLEQPVAHLPELAFLAAEANYKLTVFAPESRWPELASAIEEFASEATPADEGFTLSALARSRLRAAFRKIRPSPS